MTTPREDLLQNVVKRLLSVMRHMRHPAPPPGEAPLSPPQATLLFTIAHQEDGVPVKDLAEAIGVTPGAITQLINPLVAKGFVLRVGDATDRRIVRMKITPWAREQAEKFRQEHLAAFTQVFDVLSENELQQLMTLLEKIETSQTWKEKTNAEPDKTS